MFGPYTEVKDGELVARNDRFYKEAPNAIFRILEGIAHDFRHDRPAFESTMYAIYKAAQAVTARAMEQRYARDVYPQAIAHRQANRINAALNKARSVKGVCIHGHFYQPPRENPWTGEVDEQESASPYHDWNGRVDAECYAPNAAVDIRDGNGRIVDIANNYSKISFNFGASLLSWMKDKDPKTYAAILEADRLSQKRFSGHGSAIAQVYNHIIMPLANRNDKRTQIIWGIKDFESRFQRKPEGMWLAETAVDLESLDLMAEQAIKFTILAPRQAKGIRPIGQETWQDVSGEKVDPRVPYRCNLPSGRHIDIFFYDGPISQGIAFEGILNNGEQFAQRLADDFSASKSGAQIINVAIDGETFGHHHKFGDLALAYCLRHIESNHLAELTVYAEFLQKFPPTQEVEILENSSWSCIHGIERWRSDCGCSTGGQQGWNQKWRAPLRQSLDWLREQTGPLYETQMAEFTNDPWGARDRYIEVILDRSQENRERFLQNVTGRLLNETEKIKILKLLEMQTNAMLMYTSCGWYFYDVSGLETVQILKYAARAIQLARDVSHVDLEEGFISRLAGAVSNVPELKDGAHIYRTMVKPSAVEHPDNLLNRMVNDAVQNDFCLTQKARQLNILDEFRSILLTLPPGAMDRKGGRYWADLKEFLTAARGNETVEQALGTFEYTAGPLQDNTVYAHIMLDHEVIPVDHKRYTLKELLGYAGQNKLLVGGRLSGVLSSVRRREEALIGLAENRFERSLKNKLTKKIISEEEYRRLDFLRHAPQVRGYVDYMLLMMAVKPFNTAADYALLTMIAIYCKNFILGSWSGALMGLGLTWVIGVGIKGAVIFIMNRIYKWTLKESLELFVLGNCLALIPLGIDLAAMPLLLEGKGLWQSYRHKKPRSPLLKLFWLFLDVNLPFRSLRHKDFKADSHPGLEGKCSKDPARSSRYLQDTEVTTVRQWLEHNKESFVTAPAEIVEEARAIAQELREKGHDRQAALLMDAKIVLAPPAAMRALTHAIPRTRFASFNYRSASGELQIVFVKKFNKSAFDRKLSFLYEAHAAMLEGTMPYKEIVNDSYRFADESGKPSSLLPEIEVTNYLAAFREFKELKDSSRKGRVSGPGRHQDQVSRRINVPQRRYTNLPDGEETMLAESPSTFESVYEAFRGQVDQIYGELDERRWILNVQQEITKGINILKENNYKLTEEQAGQIGTILTGILKGMGNVQVEEKQTVKTNLTKALKGIRAGGDYLTGVEPVLSSVNQTLEIRRQRTESISWRIVYGRLRKVHYTIIKRNGGLNRRLDDIEWFRGKHSFSAVSKLLLGARALNVIKGEPDLGGLHWILTATLDALNKKQWDKVAEELKPARGLINCSILLYRLWSDYVQELINEEIRAATPVNRTAILEKVFLKYLAKAQLVRGSPGARERALWWARLYQTVFIPLHIRGGHPQTRIPNPVFKAAKMYCDILVIDTIEETLTKRNIKSHPFVAAFLESRTRKHLIREDLVGLVKEIAKDFSLDDQQSVLLQGVVRVEKRSVNPIVPPTGPASLIPPAMLPGEARRFVEQVAKEVTHTKSEDDMDRRDWRLVRRAYRVMAKEAFWEQLQLYRGWRTHGQRGLTWQKFVDLHPPKDREYINRVLKSKLDFSSNPKLSFWASVRNHYKNNRDWFYMGRGKLAMTTAEGFDKGKDVVKPKNTVEKKNADKEKDDDKERKETLILLLLILLLLLLGISLILLVKPCGCICKWSVAATVPFVVAPWLVHWCLKCWGKCRPRVCLHGIQIRKMGARIGLLGGKACKGLFLARIAVPLFLFSCINWGYPLCFGWIFFGWEYPYWIWPFWTWVYSLIVIICITITKVVIKVRERQIVLYLVGLLKQGLAEILKLMFLKVYDYDISFTTTTYEYTMVI